MNTSSFLDNVFSKVEIEKICRLRRDERLHPIAQLHMAETKNEMASRTICNIDRAYKYICKDGDEKWVANQKKRWLNTKSYSEAASALGELRCYGTLLEANYVVSPIPCIPNHSTPDFKVYDGNDEIWVEVNTPHYSDAEAKSLKEFHRNSTNKHENYKRITIQEHLVTPFGKPDKNECITENAICKLSQIKSEEKQMSEIFPSIIWLDFQDEQWHLLYKNISSISLTSWNGEFFSGELWYALYGYIGAPIFEGHSTEPRANSNIIKMRHEGRYRQKTKIDAIVISLPLQIFALENPWSKKPIPNWFWHKLTNVLPYTIEYSKINWPRRDLLKHIELEKDRIDALGELKLCRW